MSRVTIASTYRIVIPKEIRETMGLKSGASVELFPYGGRIELIPIDSVREMKGFLQGLDTTVDREDDRL